MARNLTSGTLGAVLSNVQRLVFFIFAEFVSGPVYIWNGLGTIVWNSQTWVGTGNLVTISSVSEGTDISAKGITLTLSGVDSNLLAKCLGEVRQNNPVQLWLGFLDSNGSVIADPYQSFSGHMDTATINEGVITSTIDLTLENALIDMNRPLERRWTHDDQKIDYPTDNGFVWVTAIQTWNGVWGKSGPGGTLVKPPGTGSNGGGNGGNGGGGRGGGGGGGKGCFTANVAVRTKFGLQQFGHLQKDRIVTIKNGKGECQARVLVHENYQGWCRDMGEGRLVTEDHLFRMPDGRWDSANVKYADCPQVYFEGTVYNLEVITDNYEDRHFILFNGDVAHNTKMANL